MGGRDIPRRRLAAVFLFAFSVLAYEVALTRVFSVVLAHHFVFLAISVAVCGLGLGGLGLHRWRTLRGTEASHRTMARSALAFAATSLGSLVILLMWLFPHHIQWYWLAGVLLLVPFCCAGVFLADAFERYGHRAGKLYAADLAGSGLAAVVVVVILHLFGGVNACCLASAGAAWAALLCEDLKAKRIATAAIAVLATAVPLSNLGGTFLSVGPIHVADRADAESIAKPLYLDLAGPVDQRPIILESKWNAFARTDLVENPGFGEYRDDIYQVFTNGHVPTYMMRVNADLRQASLEFAQTRIPALGHLSYNSLLAFEVNAQDRVLCIGPGAGSDVLIALMYGASEVEGAELNPSILQMMEERAEFNGYLYQRPGVSVVTAEGRSYVRRSPRKYDLIYSALTQTATAGGAVALMENYVYTLEAFRDYWEHLEDDGVLALIVHEQALLLRLFTTGITLLQEQGLDPVPATEHLAMFDDASSPYRFLFVLSKRPLPPGTVKHLTERATELGVAPMFVPGVVDGFLGNLRSGAQDFRYIVENSQSVDSDTGEHRRLDLRPCTDDRPFFFDVFDELPSGLVELCIGAAVLVLAFSLLAWFGGGSEGHSAGRIVPFTAYFSFLGAGFMLIEIPLIQKLVLVLGYPTLALTVTLFAMLVGGGLGSWRSQRVEDLDRLPARIRTFALAAAAFTVVLAFGLPLIDAFLLMQPLPLRAVLLSLGIGALGFLLGTLFPSGIRLLSRISPRSVPWMWGTNGVLSVVGSLLAVILASLHGFRVVLLVGAGVYVMAALLGPRLGERAGTDSTNTS